MFIIENRYDEPETIKIKVPDNIGKLAKVLVPYCDSQTLSEKGCNECPFYEDDWRKKDLSMCMISNMGYGSPHNWAVHKDEEGGDDNNIKRYVEPFVGGANIIDKIKCDHCIGLDKNKYLIALFRHLQEGGKLLDEVPRELYNEVRANYKNGNYEDGFVGNVGFLASYNGRWFDGGYASPVWEKTTKGLKYRDYYQEGKRNLEYQISDCKDIRFCVGCYEEEYSFGGQNYMIYCDPPYQNSKQYANSVDFNYETFWQFMRNWSKEHFVLISELQAPDDFEVVWEKPVSRSIKTTDKSTVIEKLFTYKQGMYAKHTKEKAGDTNT